MWLFGDKPKTRLDGIVAPTLVDLRVSVVSPNMVESPLTGLRAAFFRLDVVERRAPDRVARPGEPAYADCYEEVGSIAVGDTLVLAAAGGEITLVARRATIVFLTLAEGGTPLGKVTPEIAPLLARARGTGVLCFRERAIVTGDTLRVRATVEPVRQVAASGHPSDAAPRFVVRDDLGPVLVEELFEPRF